MRDIREKNWFWIENDVMDREDLDMQEKFMYITLARFSNNNDECFPSLEKLSKIIGKDKRTVIRYIKKLEEKDLIEKKKRFNKTNIYLLKNVKVNSDKNDSDKNDSDKNDSDKNDSDKNDSDISVTSNSDISVTLTIPNEQYNIPPLYPNGYNIPPKGDMPSPQTKADTVDNSEIVKKKKRRKPNTKEKLEAYIDKLDKSEAYKKLLIGFLKYRKETRRSLKTEASLKPIIRDFPSVEELKEALEIAYENEWSTVRREWVESFLRKGEKYGNYSKNFKRNGGECPKILTAEDYKDCGW